MSLSDLSGYTPVEVSPITTWIGGRVLIGMPPPSSGGVTMFEALKILEAKGYDFTDTEFGDLRIVQLIESLKHAFADRSRYLADPSFVEVPAEALLEPNNIARMSARVYEENHEPDFYGTHGLLDEGDEPGGALPDDGGTSHVCVIDPFGGAVAMTETINHEFGSKIGVNGFGFLLNNEMDDFTSPKRRRNGFGLVQSDRNLPEVGKRPLSSMSPTIVLDADGSVFAIAGASGGPRIITGTMQVLMGVMGGLDAGEAVARPRLHHQWQPFVTHFEEGYNPFIMTAITEKKRGFKQVIGDRDAVVGNVQVIVRDPDGKGWQAASDPRKGGRPSGID
jgi:gamma-glutamyltranspeptidase/glutathione hydrolase